MASTLTVLDFVAALFLPYLVLRSATKGRLQPIDVAVARRVNHFTGQRETLVVPERTSHEASNNSTTARDDHGYRTTGRLGLDNPRGGYARR